MSKSPVVIEVTRGPVVESRHEGIAAVVKQQFEVAEQIIAAGLMPIIEPEVSIKSPDKAGAEAILLQELTRHLDTLPDGRTVSTIINTMKAKISW